MSDLIQYSHRPNPKCRDEVLITVEHGYHYREVMRKCGQTATDGGRILCINAVSHTIARFNHE
jgi:hypothetical protein